MIKGFKLDENSDVLIKNNKLEMIDGDQLIRQTIEKVINTNKGEWFGGDEGINFHNLFKKGVTEDEVKAEILDGLMQIDSSFILSEFNMNLDNETRKLTVNFNAETADGEEIRAETSF